MNNTEKQIQDDSLLNGVPYQSGRESTRKSRRWQWLAPTTLALAMAVMLPSRAHAGIFDIFGELFGTIQNDMGAALSQINALTQEMQQLHQQIVWPLALVNQARGFVSNSINGYGSILYIFGPLVISLMPLGATNRIAKAYVENVFIWNAWPILYGGFGALLSAVPVATSTQAVAGDPRIRLLRRSAIAVFACHVQRA
jgi:hypothetical protein